MEILPVGAKKSVLATALSGFSTPQHEKSSACNSWRIEAIVNSLVCPHWVYYDARNTNQYPI